jgi:hypothetical protein
VLAWPVDAEQPMAVRTIEAHRGWVRALAVSPDGKTLASCGNDHLVKLWSIADGKLIRELAGHACHVYNVAFHPGGKHLVSADLKGVVKVWDLAKGEAVRETGCEGPLQVRSVLHGRSSAACGAWRSAPTARLLACAGITNVSNAFAGVGKPLVVLFDWTTGKQKQLLRPKEAFQGTAWGVVVHPSGFLAAVGGGNGGALWFWQAGQGAGLLPAQAPQQRARPRPPPRRQAIGRRLLRRVRAHLRHGSARDEVRLPRSGGEFAYAVS